VLLAACEAYYPALMRMLAILLLLDDTPPFIEIGCFIKFEALEED
jgi:hypothetical protein